MSSNLVSPNFPRVPIWRRCAALVLDVFVASCISTLVLSNGLARLFLFIFFWLFLRIIVVAKNQGQSLGRWLLNTTVIDTRLRRTPGILELSQREGLLGIIVVLTLIGISHLWSGNAGILLWTVPLVLDSGVTLFDTNQHPQTIHDRVSQTIVVGCNRGYSLDFKFQQWVKKIDKLKKDMR
jgi:uncharacterized RDD family membrane protein YckC